MVRTTRKRAAKTCRRADGPNCGANRGKKATEADSGRENSRVSAQLAERVSRGCRGRRGDWDALTNTIQGQEKPETQQNGFSQAIAWMSEPEWNAESSEVLSETLAGSREPECGAD